MPELSIPYHFQGHTSDFMDVKKIFYYLIQLTLMLVSGAFLKDAAAIIILLLILWNAVQNNIFQSIEYWLMWFFCYGFYNGQGYFTVELVSKYVAKPPFILFILFLIFLKRIPFRLKKAGYIKTWTIFLGLSLVSLVTHAQSPFVLITTSSFFVLYMLIQGKGLSRHSCNHLLNLFVSVAILQTAVSIVQLTQLIPPPAKMMDDGSGGQIEWVAGLDDVASGTFGPGTAHVVSWYASLITLLCILTWAMCRKKQYIIAAILSIMQFATVDSKTIMAVMVIMMLYLLYYLNKHKIEFRLNTKKYFTVIITASVLGYGLFSAWNFYYEFQNKTGGAASRGNFNEVYEGEIKKSRDLVIDNISDWGKIKGFQNIHKDFIREDPLQTIWGYSLLGYTYNGKMSYIENQDTNLMKLDNFTRSRSALITHFAQSGIAGFLLLISAVAIWTRFNIKKKNLNETDIVTNGLLRIFIPFTFIAAFIYSVSFTVVTTIGFAGLVGVLKRKAALAELVTIKHTEEQLL